MAIQGAIPPIEKILNRGEITATVTEKAVKYSNNKGVYLVYTKDVECKMREGEQNVDSKGKR